MKLAEAQSLMRIGEARAQQRADAGYRVHFEHRHGGMLTGDYFPERNEPSIPTLEAAWEMAAKVAAGTVGQCVNFYVVRASDLVPVEGYELLSIENRS